MTHNNLPQLPKLYTLGGMTPGIAGGRMDMDTMRAAHQLDEVAKAHILGYTNTQNAVAQVWACGVGRQGRTLFVVVPVADIRRAAVSRFASMIWDDERDNARKRRAVETDVPRVLVHGMATAMAAFARLGIDTRNYITGAADCTYNSLPKGKNGTRSDAIERMVAEWFKTFDNVDGARWIGGLNGGGYDYANNRGRIAAAHYNADVSITFAGIEGGVNVEVKGFCGRMICPKDTRAEFAAFNT